MKRKKRNDLHSKVIRYTLRNDSIGNGNYIGYCEHHIHKGIVLNDSVCIKRQCDYYRKLYVSSVGRLEGIE